MTCQHQWFEVDKIKTYVPHNHPALGGAVMKDCMCASMPVKGVRVQCANCEETKELWGTNDKN